MRTYGVNFTDENGEHQAVMQNAPNKQELEIVIKEMYGEVKINWIDHYPKN